MKYRDSIYFHADNVLYVNLFIPSTVRWKAQKAVLTQRTSFPESSGTTLQLQLEQPSDFTLKLRHPRWSKAAVVLVNGKEAARSNDPSSYVDISRRWQSGDVVELQLTMEIATDSAPATPDIVAFTYGPLVLAAALGNDGLAKGADIIVNEREIGKYNGSPFSPPVLRGDPATIARAVRRGDRANEFFIMSAEQKNVRMIPYHRIAHERYATYWQIEPPVV